jgi:hypothetical protein
MGYPDIGAGWFSKKLEYKEWYKLNNAQRIHNNSIEHMPAIMPLVLLGGIFRPRFTLALTSVVIAGRGLYTAGYMSNEGPNSKIREMGAIPLNAAEIFLILGLGALVFKSTSTLGLLKNRKIYKRYTMDLVKIKGEELAAKTIPPT